MICNERWRASRLEVETLPVEHVCAREQGHDGPCACSCGRVRIERRPDAPTL